MHVHTVNENKNHKEAAAISRVWWTSLGIFGKPQSWERYEQGSLVWFGYGREQRLLVIGQWDSSLAKSLTAFCLWPKILPEAKFKGNKLIHSIGWIIRQDGIQAVHGYCSPLFRFTVREDRKTGKVVKLGKEIIMESWKVVHKNGMEKKASVIVKDIGIIENKHSPFKACAVPWKLIHREGAFRSVLGHAVIWSPVPMDTSTQYCSMVSWGNIVIEGAEWR